MEIIITINSDFISILSLIITIILGVCALWQAKRYNDASGKINNDTKYMMLQQIYLINELQKSYNLGTYESHRKLRLEKDRICLHKLNSYNKKNSNSIMQEIHKLSIKERFMPGINNFLTCDEIDYSCNFWGKAEFKENSDINFMEFYSILLKYDILVIIQNKTW